jgi:phospholipid/cholesterol/gamma-HCH transport system substrate-binding protein
METRARYALIGLFMLAVIIAGFAFIYWLENKGGFGKQDIYQVRFQGSVSGLQIGSAVLFNGLRIGDVTKVSLSPERPQDVVATIAVVHNTPVRDDTEVTIETQGLTGGAAIALSGGTSSSPLPASENGAPPMLLAAPDAGQDWTQAARDAFQQMDQVLTENSESLNSAIKNIDTFAGALARNSDKVDGILAGIERLTGGGTAPADMPVYDLVAATNFPSKPAEAPSWTLVVPEPSTLMGFNTDKILLQPESGESVPVANVRWGDNLPILVQAKIVQSFENAGYTEAVSRTRDGLTGDYQLLIDIRRFHISTAKDAVADIDFIAKLANKDGKIIAASTFQASTPVNGSDAQAYVNAFDEAFVKLETDLINWTATTLASEPPPIAEPAPAEQPSAEQPPAEPSVTDPDQPPAP